MPPQRARSPARLLAPAALGLFALAVVLIVLSSAGGGEGAPRGADTAEEGSATTTPVARRKRRPRSTYTVRPRDTLGSIAQKTGIEVQRLQELNPQLDPQALIAGQKIKLRE
ncbi:MAG: LysM domain-containing protein [Actinomycetota bacterium]|nr:LysM domain-containing protein [Actinomycetota bacterium]